MDAVNLYVPEIQTLSPAMLLARRRAQRLPPFDRPARFYFYARNAVWRAVRLLGLEGRDVLVPAYHHGVEIAALVDAGARPVFYRVREDWSVDLEDLERRIGPETGALYLTHFAGFPGPWREMRALADRHGLPLIEDCALALLSSDGDVPLGLAGDVAIHCLYKTLPVPEGGTLVVHRGRDDELRPVSAPPAASVFNAAISSILSRLQMKGGRAGRAVRAAIRLAGHSVVRAARIERVTPGDMDFDRTHLDLGASWLTRRIAATQDLERIIAVRRRNYEVLAARLADVGPPVVALAPGVCPLFYPVRVVDKQAAVDALTRRGVIPVDFWRFFHPACDPAEFPEVARLREEVLEIPCHQDIDEATLERVAEAARDVLAAQRRPDEGQAVA